MTVIQVTASRFFGGPERQMLELANTLKDRMDTVFVSLSERGRCRDFLGRASDLGFRTVELESDTPHILAAAKELAEKSKHFGAEILFCEGYKPDLIGLLAASKLAVPVASISRGWTRESWRVRIYESLDRIALRYLDHVVCVSQEQANRVQAAGVPLNKTSVIRNAVRSDRFDHRGCESIRQSLLDLFPSPPRFIVGSAGRLSPEKGFGVFIDAAKKSIEQIPNAGFVIFGDGVLREELQRQINNLGLEHNVVLAGFRDDLDDMISNLDLFVLSSYTEGLPNVVLESLAASVPVVATRVGGTPEVFEHGVHGYIVSPGKPDELARAVIELLSDDEKRKSMASVARPHVDAEFSFRSQADAYLRLIERLKAGKNGK